MCVAPVNLKPYDAKIRPVKDFEKALKSTFTPVADMTIPVTEAVPPEIESDGGLTTGFRNASDGDVVGVVTGAQ